MESRNREIKSLKSLNSFRSAPELGIDEYIFLQEELAVYMRNADWFTIGIMATSIKHAIEVIREMENHFSWKSMNLVPNNLSEGSVFLKANQKTGDIHVRLEDGLGVGILISCQYNEPNKNTETFGPFPLDFFRKEN